MRLHDSYDTVQAGMERFPYATNHRSRGKCLVRVRRVSRVVFGALSSPDSDYTGVFKEVMGG